MLLDLKTRAKLLQLLFYSSLNYLLIGGIWIICSKKIAFLEDKSNFGILSITLVLILGVFVQINLILINVLNALDNSMFMVKSTILRLIGTLISFLINKLFNGNITAFILLLIISEVSVTLILVKRVILLDIDIDYRIMKKILKFSEFLNWVQRTRLQALSGILVSFVSVALQYMITSRESSYENGVFNISLRVSSLLLFPLSIPAMKMLSQRNQLKNQNFITEIMKKYLLGSISYVTIVGVFFFLYLNITKNVKFIPLVIAVSLYIIGTSNNTFLSNIFIDKGEFRLWALSDIWLSVSGFTLIFLTSIISMYSAVIGLLITAISLLSSSVYMWARLKKGMSDA
jgi:hypothetical protein